MTFFLVLSVMVGVAWAAQCACRCNNQVFEPNKVASCTDCTYVHCLEKHPNSICTRINSTVQTACNEVEPCPNAFEATLCITDRAVGLKCIDQRGILDPWQLDCRCAPIAATCLAENNCTFPPDLKAECDQKCGNTATPCEPTASAAAHLSATAAAALLALLLAAMI